jgi:levanase/levanbiose-producing levanase
MTLARELRLTAANGSARLVQQPVLPAPWAGDELPAAGEHMDAGTFELENSVLRLPYAAPGSAQVIEAEILPGSAAQVAFHLFAHQEGSVGTVLSYHAATAQLVLDRRRSGNTAFHGKFPSVESAPLVLEDGVLKLQIVIDHCSVEVFAQGGTVVLTDLIFPDTENQENWLSAEGGSATILKLAVSTLT